MCVFFSFSVETIGLYWTISEENAVNLSNAAGRKEQIQTANERPERVSPAGWQESPHL